MTHSIESVPTAAGHVAQSQTVMVAEHTTKPLSGLATMLRAGAIEPCDYAWIADMLDKLQPALRAPSAPCDAAVREALKGLRLALIGLIEDSHGVAGLHLNGDVAPWDELISGGRFEEWLGPAMDQAEAALALPTPGAGGWSQAVADVLAERHRQVSVEGWTPEHDDGHRDGELAMAAACYAASATKRVSHINGYPQGWWATLWPWCLDWWKPSTPRRDLVKAVALGLAEIERLDRQAAAPGATP